MALSEPENALPFLSKAIDLDKGYALKAAADGDFQRHESELRGFLEALRQEKMRQLRPKLEAALRKYAFWLERSEDMRQDRLVQKARSLVQTGLPLWDLLAAQEELAGLAQTLADRASGIRFVDRIEEPGPVHKIEEKYLEPVPESAGFFRKLGGPKERTRFVRISWRLEHILIRDATGTVCSQISFCLVPPARFKMCRRVDGLVYSVNITRAFLLSATPVTITQYEALIRQPQSKYAESALPIVNVSWQEAVTYCNALSRECGLEEAYEISPRGVRFKGLDCDGYRLPTEAEWERACWKDSVDLGDIRSASELDELAWVAENSGHTLHPVALKKPNAWGLYDMLGNVSEWVFDWYVDSWPCPEADPIGPDERQVVRVGSNFVADATYTLQAKGKTTRGGSYADSEDYIKHGGLARPVDPATKNPTLGFRLARTATHS